MNSSSQQRVLVTVSGPDTPGITASLTGIVTAARQKSTDAVSVDDAHASVGRDIDGALVEAVAAEVGAPPRLGGPAQARVRRGPKGSLWSTSWSARAAMAR
jgi:hypothetical protein